MKKLIYTFAGLVVAGGIGFYVMRQGDPKLPESRATSGKGAGFKSESVGRSNTRTERGAEGRGEKGAPNQRAVVASGDSGQAATYNDFHSALNRLVSPEASYAEKQGIWKQLREAEQLDLAISELELRIANEPVNAQYPATLGQAYLQKAGTTQEITEQGILGMKADQSFTAALGLDPTNWEARFTKGVAMSYWPTQLNKGDEVIKNFTELINQQEAQAARPEFAESYRWLGDQYEKMGRKDDAVATWQRGVALFPGVATLVQKLAKSRAQ